MKTEDGYHYLLLLIVVVVAWGVVPGFAKLGDLPGDITTFWVNIIALLTLIIIITAGSHWTGCGWENFRQYHTKDYLTMSSLGLAWPLTYSLAYFQSVQDGGPALTAIMNYTWPAFCLIFTRLISKNRMNRIYWLIIFGAVFIVALMCFLEYRANINFTLVAIVLGLIAATTQGFYSAATDRWRYNPLVMTFVVETITVIGVTIFALCRHNLMIPSPNSLIYLGIIGAVSNGLGFWAFVAGNQRTGDKTNPYAKGVWLLGLCFVPFGQVIILPILGIEKISPWKWMGIILITFLCVVLKLYQKRTAKKQCLKK